jgi:hypothetical protein
MTCSNLDFMHRRGKVAGQKPLKAKPSPAIISSTPDAPIRRTAPSTSAPKVSKMAEALAKDAMPATTPARGPKKVNFGGKMVGIAVGAGDAAKWKKKADALFRLDGVGGDQQQPYFCYVIVCPENRYRERGMYSL